MNVKVGDMFLVNRRMADGVTMPELLTVVEVSRGKIVLQAENGDRVVMLR